MASVHQDHDIEMNDLQKQEDLRNLNEMSNDHYRPSRMRLWKLVLFSLFPIGYSTLFSFTHAVMLPGQIIRIIGDEKKATWLGIIGACSALSTVVTGPIAGYISDHTVTPFGKRMPYIVIGSLLYALFTMMRVFIESPGVFMLVVNAILLIIGDMSSQIAVSCYLGLFPDLFPEEQIGMLSGMNSFVTILATALGVSVLGFLYGTIVPKAILIACVGSLIVFACAVLAIVFREPAFHYSRKIKWIDPTLTPDQEEEPDAPLIENTMTMRLGRALTQAKFVLGEFCGTLGRWNFLWLFITRSFFTLGLGVVQNFSLFFFRDKVGPTFNFFSSKTLITNAQQAQAVFMIFMLGTGLVSSVIGGPLSDKFGRRIVITISTSMLGLGCFSMAFLTFHYTLLLLCAIIMGIGVGAFFAADLGLANDIIDTSQSAKELSMFQVAQTLPMVISAPIGGIIVQLSEIANKNKTINVNDIGYNILLLFGASLCLCTASMIWCVRKPKRIEKKKNRKPPVVQPTKPADYNQASNSDIYMEEISLSSP